MVSNIIKLINKIIDDGKKYLNIDFINALQQVKIDLGMCASWIDSTNVKKFYFKSLKAHIKKNFGEKEKKVLDVLTNHIKKLERKGSY